MELRMHNFRIGTRIGMALALPIAGLLAFSLWTLAGYYRTASDMKDVRSMAEFAPKASTLVHSLQRERGLSVNFIGSSSIEFTEKLSVQYKETDKKKKEYSRALLDYDALRFGGGMAGRIKMAQEAIDQIGVLRQAVANQTATLSEVTRSYTDTIEKLIQVIEEIQVVSKDANLTRTVYAYTHLMRAKEEAGIERAIGSAGFASGRFDQDGLEHFVELIQQQRFYLKEFTLFASDEEIALLNKVLSSGDALEVERMRQIAIGSHITGSTGGISASQWFEIVSRKIDLLKMVESNIASNLITQASNAELSAKRSVLLVAVLTAAVLILTTLLAATIARGIIYPLVRSTNAMKKLAARDEAVQINDDQRGDEIGDMARALIVFKENLLRVAQAEAQLNNEAILRLHYQALESISQGVLITDADRRITYANRAFQNMTGYSESDILGKTPSFLHKSDLDVELLDELRAALNEGDTFNGSLLNYRKDGEPYWSDLSITPVKDNEGKITHFVGIKRDVTESRQIQQELRIAAAAFETSHGIMVTDVNGLILRVNRAFTEMTGYSTEEVMGRTPSLLKSGRHGNEFYAEMWRQLIDTGNWSGEIWDRRKNGEIFPKWQTISAVCGIDKKTTHYVAAFTDISERKEAEENIRTLAFYDPLTQLPNRRLLLDRLQQGLVTSGGSKRQGALLFIDLDDFKTLNDTLGHDKGDQLLQKVAQRISSNVRDGDTVARLGGDEFVVILENLSEDAQESATQAEAVCKKLLARLNQPYNLSGHEHHSTASIGITLFPSQEMSIEELLKQADLAMYQAKTGGRNTLRFFSRDMQAAVTARALMESDLREAVRDDQFIIHYQAQFNSEGCLTGAEALVRWQHPRRGMVPPSDFIPLAEKTGLILPLGSWVLETVCNQLAKWALMPNMTNFTVAVNVSARQFRQPDFVEQVLAVLERTGVDPKMLKLELTESLFLDDVEDIISKMNALKEFGISFSLDDFGTGYSSLSYLKRLPLNQLKIDRTFVRDVLTNVNDAAIACTIVTLAQSLGLAVIAEGVETEHQRDFLAQNGCHAYQGYFFGRPQPLERFEDLLLPYVTKQTV